MKSGDYLGFINFSVLPINSSNVYDFPYIEDKKKTIPSEIKIGDGILSSYDYRFYAKTDGVPRHELQSLFLDKNFIYKGVWNSTCGDLNFDGDCEIQGAIEGNVILRVSGCLKVTGHIQGAQIFCGKDFTCIGGVNTGRQGSITVGGNLCASFIENSSLYIFGSVVVDKSIVNSQVISKKSILVKNPNTGLISGGLVNAFEYVKTSNLGSRDGSKTKIFVGENWLLRVCIERRNKRLSKLKSIRDREKSYLEGLNNKSKLMQGIKKHEIKTKITAEKVKKLDIIIIKLKNHITVAEKKRYKNPSSMIIVKKKLSSNCDLFVSRQTLILNEEHNNIALIRNRHHGRNVAIIETDYAEELINDNFKNFNIYS